jgi:hypothetical protein
MGPARDRTTEIALDAPSMEAADTCAIFPIKEPYSTEISKMQVHITEIIPDSSILYAKFTFQIARFTDKKTKK